MKILYTAISSERTTNYKFYNEKILASVGDHEILFDLTNIEVGKQYAVHFPISEIKRNEDGDLEVTLFKFYNVNSAEEDRFPKPFIAEDMEFETKLEPIFLKEIKEQEVNLDFTEWDYLTMAIADLDAQREQDKIEQQLALAELASTILGGNN